MNVLYLNDDELTFLINLVGQLPTKLGAQAVYDKLVQATPEKEQDEDPTQDAKSETGLDSVV
jgi:hypothetical protein